MIHYKKHNNNMKEANNNIPQHWEMKKLQIDEIFHYEKIFHGNGFSYRRDRSRPVPTSEYQYINISVLCRNIE